MNINITCRKLTQKETELFIEEIKYFPNPIIGDRKRWKRLTKFYVATSSKNMLGICGVFVKNGYVMLDPVVIRGQYQGNGYGTIIIKRVIDDYPTYKLYFGSWNPGLWKIANKLGFEEIHHVWNLPWDIKFYLLNFTIESLNISFMKELLRKGFKQRNQFRHYIKKKS
jgi:hypothetical protein